MTSCGPKLTLNSTLFCVLCLRIAWFVFTQVAVTLCLVADMISFGMAFVIWLRTGMTQRDPYKKPPRDPFKMIHVLCGITVGSGKHQAV